MYILKANKVIAWLPIFWIVLFWTFVGIVTLEYGHSPRYNAPDPEDSIFGFLHSILFFGIGVIPFLMFISFVIQAIIFFFEKEQFSWKVLGFQVLGVLVFVIHFMLIPSRVIEWFGD